MRPTSARASVRASRRGFTLIEMSVVVVVLTVLAAISYPNFVREREARERRTFFTDVGRLAGEARELAITEKKTIALTLDSSGRSFNLIEESEEDGEVERKQLAMPSGVETGSLNAEGGNSNSEEWRIRFYPDGSSDGGGVELVDGGRERALEIKPEGTIRMVDGPLEESGTERWPAGEYEKRI